MVIKRTFLNIYVTLGKETLQTLPCAMKHGFYATFRHAEKLAYISDRIAVKIAAHKNLPDILRLRKEKFADVLAELFRVVDVFGDAILKFIK